MSDYLRTLLGGLAHYCVQTGGGAAACFNGPPGVEIPEAYAEWLGVKEDTERGRLDFLAQMGRKLGLTPVSTTVVDLAAGGRPPGLLVR